jgi:hypothetical protein
MPIATLRFNLDEEEHAFKAALYGSPMKNILWEIDQYCRNLLKHGDPSDETQALAAHIRSLVRELPFDIAD